LRRPDSFFANETESKVEQMGEAPRSVMMKTVRSIIPRISERQSEMLREKLSDYVASLLEKNAARLAKYEKASREATCGPNSRLTE
jgi:hypothetical protein